MIKKFLEINLHSQFCTGKFTLDRIPNYSVGFFLTSLVIFYCKNSIYIYVYIIFRYPLDTIKTRI